FSDRVLERTGGNPFFVEELSKMMLDNGDIYHADDDWQRRALAEIQMPLSVRETLLARARTMEPRSYEILRIAAVSAIDLDLAVLAGAAGATPEQVDDAVKEGLAQQVLVEHREGHSVRYAFRHALSREAFADELVGPDRSRAHRAVAEAISQVHADDLDSVAAALADHFAESGDQVAALEFALRAARSAAAAFAVEEADSRYDQALRLMGPADDRRLEVLLEAAGDREFSDISRTRISFAEEARRLAMANGDRLAEARMLYVLENAAWLAGDTAGSIGLLREALDRVHGIDDHEEAWTLRRLTRVLTLGDHLDEAAALLPGSIELARSSGNLGALSGLYGTRMLQEGHGDGFRSAYTAAVETARSAGDVMSEYNVSINAGYVSIWSGDFAESRRSMRHAVAMGEQIAPRDRYAAAGLAWLLSLTGEYVEAKAIAAKLGPSYPLPTRVVALTALTEVAQREGDPEAAALSDELWDLARSTGENQRSVPALAARARQTLIDSGVDEALPLFQAAATNTVNTRMGGSQWPFAPDLAGALGAQGRTVELESWVELVSRIGANDPHAHNLASSTLCRGFVASSHGDLDQALALFEEAAARYRALPCPAREVEALLGQSDVESRAGRPDGGSGSAGRAFDLATSIGAVLLADQSRQAVERSQAQPVLATILFTDIVGSTELAASLGDRAWREMLTRHHSIVRRELARGRGREVDTAGDGFHVAFDTPAQAIRCAVAVRDSLAAAGISIRAGVHTGECQESGGKLTGLAVHIASRVSQRAEPGEVLASGTVRELVVGSGFSFEERGSHQLKGVPGEWLLFAVRR
ncbi:MAG: hypothetical protein QOJ60_108, partial [Actinomycetota bacterium]|nr:hypothetical protein [Actinomycetota bacterium]